MAGYHEHFVRRASAAQRRHLSDDALLVHIKAIHAQTTAATAGRGPGRNCSPGASAWASSGSRSSCSCMAYAPRASAASRSPPTAITTCRSRPTCSTGSSPWPSPTRSGRATSPTSPPTKAGCPGGGHRPVQPPGGGLVAAVGHDARHRHRCTAHGLVQAPSEQAGRADLPQRPGQPIRQPGLPGCAHRVRHHRLDEPARQLLGQRLQRNAVRVVEGGAAARPTLQDPAPGQGRNHCLAALVQP